MLLLRWGWGLMKEGVLSSPWGVRGVSETVVLVHLVTQQVACVPGAWGRQPSIQCMYCEPVLPLGELLVR